MNISDLIDPSFSYRLIITLMHFVWQGCLVALLAILGDGLLSRVSASRRYALHVAALAIMVVSVAVTFSRIESSASAPEALAESTALAAVTGPAAPGRDDVESSSMQSVAASGFVGGESSFPELPPVAVADDAVEPSSVRQERLASDGELWRPFRQWAPQITLLYFACCGLLLARLIRGTGVAQRLRRMATVVTDDWLVASLQRQSKELGLRVLPGIAWCAEVSIPLVIGVFKPMILLPTAAATGLTPDQLQALITHELAHIRRYDLLVNLVQRVVESMLFFHPAVWFISRRISHEREQACDELVLATGCERLRYADALVRMAELSSSLRNLGTSAPATALAASGANSSEFKRRVLKVLSVPTTSHLRPSRIALLAIVTLIVGVTVSATRLPFKAFAVAHSQDSSSTGSNDEPSTNNPSETNERDKDEPMATDAIVEVFQEFTPDNLPVQDVSHIRDPDQLLDQLEKGPRVSHFSMTGGGYFLQAETAPQSWQVEMWNRTFAGDKGLDPRVRQLIKLGDAARAKVQQRLATAKPPVKSHLALVLRSTGNAESIPVLIQSLHDLNKSDQATMASSAMSTIAVTSALWELTGRKHHYIAKEWDQWWKGVGPNFVVSRDRQRPEISALVTKQRVQVLVTELAKQEVVARERLIALGPAAVPHVLESLQDELKKQPAEVTIRIEPARTMAQRLAWVVDELGATNLLPRLLRRNYFAQRFADGGTSAGLFPIDEDALCRAISHCSFAEYCAIYLEADSQGIVQPHGKWPLEFHDAYGRRFQKQPPHVVGEMSQRPFWNKVVPATDPTSQITDAVPVLLAALKDERVGMRKGAAKLAAAIGFCSDVKPQTLVVALRDAWVAETVDNVRPEFAFAMCRFATPFVEKEISNGLFSDRPEIVSDSAGLMDWIPIQLNAETRPSFERLVELTHHENNKLRQRAVTSLRGKAVTLLEPELLRLSQDPVVEIRKECASALRDTPDPKFADILFQLASDSNEQVRLEAINSIGNLNHPESMPRLVPLLRDKQVHGYAVSALASMGGKDALPLLLDELQTGNAVGGMIYQHLKRLTGEKFEDKPEPWLGWWKQQPTARKISGPTIVLPDHLNVMAVGFDRDSQDLVTVAIENDVAVRVWDLAEKKLKREVKFETDQHGNFFLRNHLTLSGDRQHVIVILDGKVTIWESATGKLVKTLTLPKELENGFLRGLTCTPDLSVVACGRTPGFGGRAVPDAHAIVWDVAARRVLRTVTHANAVQIQSVALSSDGKFLATGGQAAGMCLWDVGTGKLLHQLPNDNPGRKHPDPEVSESGANQVLCLRFSPDGLQLALGDMLGVKLVDVKTGKLLFQCDAPFRFGRSGLVFSKDGQLLARTATDKVVPIWSTQTGKLFAELPTEAHDGSFSDDGRSFAVGFTDAQKGLAVWQLSDDPGKAEKAEGPGPDSPIDKVAEPAAELEQQIQLNGRELFFGRMELAQEFEMLWPTKDQEPTRVTSKGTVRWLKNPRLTRIDSDRMIPFPGTIDMQPEQWTTGHDGVNTYSWNRAAKLISYGALRPAAIGYSPNLLFWGRTAIAFPSPMFGDNPKITRATRDGREEIDVVVDIPAAKVSVHYVGIVPDRGYLPTRVETRSNERLDSQVEFQDFFQPRPGVWAPKTILWTAWSADKDANGKPNVVGHSKMTVTKLELGEDAKLEDEDFKLKLPDGVKVVDGVVQINNLAEPKDEKQPAAGIQAPLPPLEFRIAAQPTDSKVEPRVPADYAQRDYSGNSVIGRMIAKDKGFIWVPVAGPTDQKISPLPVERLRGGQVREALLADTPEHALGWNGKWSIENCRVVPDPNNAGRFLIMLKLDEAGGTALKALTKSHLNQPLAILVNNSIVVAPIVLDEFGQNIAITGTFTREQAEKLAEAIRACRLRPETAPFLRRG